MENKTPSQNPGKVVDLTSFRKKKEVTRELAGDRTPLYVSHLDGKVKGSPHLKDSDTQDFGDRLQRIRMSLEKINNLMQELKKMSTQEEPNKRESSTLLQ